MAIYHLQRSLFATVFAVCFAQSVFSIEAPITPGCDRTCLRTVTDQYLKALLAHNPALAPMDSKVRYTENAATVITGDGIWKTASSLREHQQYYQDAMTGNALFRGVLNETGVDTPAIVAIRIKAPAGKITEVETIIARKGGHVTYTPDALTTVDPRLTQVVPLDQRSTREQLKTIVETYWDGITQHDSNIVLAAKGCDRFENGRKVTNNTAPGSSLTVQTDCAGSASRLTQISNVPERRYYLFDEEHGIVIGTFTLDIPPTPARPETPATAGAPVQPATPASAGRMPLICEVFKVIDGKMQYIEATLLNMPYPTRSGW